MKVQPPVDWLLKGPSWANYRTRLDLMHQLPGSEELMRSHEKLLADNQVQNLVASLAEWPGEIIASHKSAGQPFHRLTFLADLGMTKNDPGIQEIILQIMASQAPEGPFELPMNIGEAYGGSGQQQSAWALCDAPLLLYALVKFGLSEDKRVRKGIDYLAGLARENGWPCVVSEKLGKWRGPGKKDDPCPFATLAMLKLLAEVPDLNGSPASHAGVESVLHLWETSQTNHPYIFYMGDDFRKLKAPFIWYDLLHVLEVLSKFDWAKEDSRFKNMVNVLKGKMDEDGKFTVESVWMAWKEWEFGQKKVPSYWLTLAAWRILQRCDV